jgi:protein-disulfide isomerase
MRKETMKKGWKFGSEFSWELTKRLLGVGFFAALLAMDGNAQTPAQNTTNPESMFLSLEGTPVMGDAKAPLTIIEFGDYECPYCGRHSNQVLPQIIDDYVKTGKVRYFFKDTPIESIHPQAFKAAEAALCAGEQGKYWEMHDRLFKNQQTLAVNQLPAHAAALGLDLAKFRQCLDQDTYSAEIRKSIQDAMKSGLRGTPTFLVGTLDGKEPTDVTVLSGGQPFLRFQQILDQMLAQKGDSESVKQVFAGSTGGHKK